MKDLILLWGYGLAFFAVAYLLPPKLYVVRFVLGYTSLVVFGTAILGAVVPSVADKSLFVLNGTARFIWNLTE